MVNVDIQREGLPLEGIAAGSGWGCSGSAEAVVVRGAPADRVSQ